jgi:hypothetical protein
MKQFRLTILGLFFVLASVIGVSRDALAQSPAQINQLNIAVTPTCAAQSLSTWAGKPFYWLYMDYLGNLCVGANVTATATTTATASATPTTVAPGAGAPLNIDLHSSLFVQPTFAGVPVDGTHGFPVNCIVGCAGGTSNNNADGVATSATNGQTLAWLYAWNGVSWDRLQDDASKNLKVNVAAAIAAGANIIGKVGIDQTTPGTTNGVQVNAALPAGTNLMGKVGIDQTTPGTTNGVQVNAALPAGTNLIGKTGIDQTTDGTTNGVRQTNAYPAGATPITASATGTTAATTAILAGTAGKTTYICSYSVRANATAAATVTDTVTGVITATMSSILWVAPLASGLGVDEQIFTPCVPASATNTGIAVVSGAPGTGGTVSVHATGYQQ